MENKLNFNVGGNGDNLKITLVDGEELPLKEPVKIIVIGGPGSIISWLEKRKSEINEKVCLIIVDKNKFTSELLVDEKNFYRTQITSKLSLSPEYLAFGINTEKSWDAFKLADFIKMNRSFLESRSVSDHLVHELKNFSAKVNKEIEKRDDNKGNTEDRKKQFVESNLPDNFRIKIPVFKGCEPITIELEVYIDPFNLNCSLISPEANDFIHEQSEEIIETELEQIRTLCPDIAILYV